MEYDNSIHLPQQIENLLHHRSEGSIEGFEHILKVVKTIMNDEQLFVTALTADSNKKEKRVSDKAKVCKETIFKAFTGISDLQGCQTVQSILSQLESEYNTIMVDYMNDVIETIMSYNDRRTTDE